MSEGVRKSWEARNLRLPRYPLLLTRSNNGNFLTVIKFQPQTSYMVSIGEEFINVK